MAPSGLPALPHIGHSGPDLPLTDDDRYTFHGGGARGYTADPFSA